MERKADGKVPRIKICGLSRPCDVEYVNEAEPDFCGFIINFPKSIRNVSPEKVRELTADLNPGITPVGVFVNEPQETILKMVREGTITHIQLHGQEDDAYIHALREKSDRNICIIKAFKVRDSRTAAEAQESTADLVLLDNGSGSGKRFDWSLIQGIERHFLLAGGLTPQNIGEAVREVHPWGVDLSSGVETGGVKDREKILAAVRAARKAGG